MVIDDAMISRVQASDNRVMIRESESREYRNQARLGLGPVRDQPADVRGRSLELVPEPEPIGRDQKNHRLLQLLERASGFN